MSFNPNLSYYLDRLAGFSTNYFRLETQNQTSAVAGQIITLDLPDNSLLHLRSLKILCNVSTAGANTGARLCPIDNLMDKVEISVGGIILSQGSNFQNVLLDAMVKMGQKECDPAQGHPELVRERHYDYTDITPLTTTDPEIYSTFPFPNFAMSNFLGFLDSVSPRIIDTSILPSLRVRITLAPNTVLASAPTVQMADGSVLATRTITTSGSDFVVPATTNTHGFAAGSQVNANAASATYSLSNIHAIIECCGLANEVYDNMIAAMMSQQGFIELPYKNYQSFQETHTGTSRFTVSSASIDRVWTTWRASDFNTIKKPVAVNGYKNQAVYVINGTDNTAAPNLLNIGGSNAANGFDTGGVFDSNKEKYVTDYFNYPAPYTLTNVQNATVTQQLQLNSAYFPNFPAQFGDILAITKNSLPMGGDYLKNMTMSQYLHNYCIACYRFNLPGSESARVLSGIDSRSSNLQGIVKTTNAAAANAVLNIFVECTSVLRVGAGRSVEIVS